LEANGVVDGFLSNLYDNLSASYSSSKFRLKMLKKRRRSNVIVWIGKFRLNSRAIGRLTITDLRLSDFRHLYYVRITVFHAVRCNESHEKSTPEVRDETKHRRNLGTFPWREKSSKQHGRFRSRRAIRHNLPFTSFFLVKLFLRLVTTLEEDHSNKNGRFRSLIIRRTNI